MVTLNRQYWSDFDARIYISKLRDGARSGASTSASDEVGSMIVSVEDPGFTRDITFDRTISNQYILRKGGYQPVQITVRFIMSNDKLHNYSLNTLTQSGITIGRLSNTIKPCKIKLQWETKDTAGNTTGQEIYKRIYYNAYPTNFSLEEGDNEELVGVLTFLVSPFNEFRLPNYREAWKASGDSLTSFNNLEYSAGAITEWDVQMGYSAKV